MFRVIEYKAYLFNPITYKMREKLKGGNCKAGGGGDWPLWALMYFN